MKRLLGAAAAGLLVAVAMGDQPALTVYNHNFGVVRERISLDLQNGVTHLEFNQITAHLEPDSVVLRDPTGERQLQILEQNYRNDPLSQDLLLSLYEGQTIDFVNFDEHAPNRQYVVRGKIIRSGYVPHRAAWNQYGSPYLQRQVAPGGEGAGQPLIEVNGRLRFGLPGTPVFPRLGDDTILKPTLTWTIAANLPGPFTAELSYITGGMSWQAAYNILAPEDGDTVDLVGWVTIDNQSGRTFTDAQLKLMAGDVSKLAPDPMGQVQSYGYFGGRGGGLGMPPVTEKTFDEYHLYTLTRPTTLRDRETKQVEFVRAAGVNTRRAYVYDGANWQLERYRGWDPASLRIQNDLTGETNTKVWVVREFKNTSENQLGLPIPAGTARFYRRDDDGRHEFVGENRVDHTPRDELVRLYTGNAFDLVGERKRTHFKVDSNQQWVDESFEIRLRNHKSEAVEIRVVEHLLRWFNWEIREPSHQFTQQNSQKIEFLVQVPAAGETVITYNVHYSW